MFSEAETPDPHLQKNAELRGKAMREEKEREREHDYPYI
jgi:hypothetical protein